MGRSTTQSHPPPRVIIEGVEPEIDGGRFPIKRTVGEHVDIMADIFADGYDKLTAVLRYRLADHPSSDGAAHPDTDWHEVYMDELGNDRWGGRFTVEGLGRYEYSLEAWIDRFGTWREELSKKFDVQMDVASELGEGARLVRQTAGRLARAQRAVGRASRARRAPATAPAAQPASASDSTNPDHHRADPHDWLLAQAEILSRPGDQATRVAAALSRELAAAMRQYADRSEAVPYARVLSVNVERPRARFGAWYEMFPRSAGPDPTRSATFSEAARRLPEIAAMGFDVLYLPPIHPIGRSFRKGRNHALAAGPNDPGSPWAIGSSEGGHMAVEPGLGTLEDFDRFAAAARGVGLEIALDLAYQCSPDHPYAREHPDWFRQRPDGSIKYAENPPKKYQDIYPFDFETRDWRALWDELRAIVSFWVGHGVRIFRVDNPHTKPFRFWEWLIAEVRKTHPDVIFLSEAFTRPKVMRYLAKTGFSQSYTYFTWRNTKAELTEYFTELTERGVREFMRPNLFANTPDILHEYLQRGGRPAFQVRLVLAATLGASYGIYNGFELCENRALPGTEEYAESEKYQFRQWDWDRPGHIKDLIARVNRIRRENVALQADWSLQFHPTDNDHLLCYSKATPNRSNVILVVVNLDPFHMQHGIVRVPIVDWRLRETQTFEVHDLLSDERYVWRGESNYVRLDPGFRPAHILRVEP